MEVNALEGGEQKSKESDPVEEYVDMLFEKIKKIGEERALISKVANKENEEAMRAFNELRYLLASSSPSKRGINKMRKLLRSIDNEILILEKLGPALVKKYFAILESNGFYTFLLNLKDEELDIYLDFEMNYSEDEEGVLSKQKECLIGHFFPPYSVAGVNLIISNFKQYPYLFPLILFDENLKKIAASDEFLIKVSRKDNPTPSDYFVQLRNIVGLSSPNLFKALNYLFFDVNRCTLLGKYFDQVRDSSTSSSENMIMKKIKKADSRFFGKNFGRK